MAKTLKLKHKDYVSAELEVICFDSCGINTEVEDVITVSNEIDWDVVD